MKAHYKLALGVLVGIVIGTTGIIVLHAQSTPPSYVIAENDVTDPATYQTFAAQIPSTVEAFKGRFVVRGGKTDPFDGPPPKRIVVIAFDSMATARKWYESPAYQAILPIRQRSSTGRLFVVEGVSP